MKVSRKTTLKLRKQIKRERWSRKGFRVFKEHESAEVEPCSLFLTSEGGGRRPSSFALRRKRSGPRETTEVLVKNNNNNNNSALTTASGRCLLITYGCKGRETHVVYTEQHTQDEQCGDEDLPVPVTCPIFFHNNN